MMRLGISLCLLCAASPAQVLIPAQQSEELDRATSGHAILQEVVVTAQRREESQQRVPVAVTTWTGEQLEHQKVVQVSDLQYLAPSLTMTPTNGSNTTLTIAMRGQVEFDFVPTVDPAVGLFVDDVYLARATGANMVLFDMERVEILRGPQGTLFGRDTIGGAISLHTNKPSGAFEGSLQVGTGNYDLNELSGVLNVPFGATSAARVVYKHTDHAGYGRNILLDQGLNSGDADYARAQLRLSPSHQWDLNLAFDFSQLHRGNQLVTLAAAHPPFTLIPAAAGNPSDDLSNYIDPVAREVPSNRTGRFDFKGWGSALTLTVPTERFTVRSIASYREIDQEISNNDLDGTPYDLAAQIRQTQAQHQMSAEVQAYGASADQRWQWIGGLNYFSETAGLQGRAIALVPVNSATALTRGTAHNDSWAAYGQLTFGFAPRWAVVAGVRANIDSRNLVSGNAILVGSTEICAFDSDLVDQVGVCQLTTPPQRFSYVPFTLGIEYHPAADTMLYAKVSRGHRSGGYSFRGTTSAELHPYDEEQVTAYETGAKTELLGQRLRVNLALFHSEYEDIQVSVHDEETDDIIVQNAGAARIDGAEAEVTALIGALQLSAMVGVVDARYTSLRPDTQDITLDSKFRNVPAQTYSVALDLPVALRSHELAGHVDYSGRSQVRFDVDPAAMQSAYNLLNATASITFAGSRLQLSVWGRNLTDTRYVTRALGSGYVHAFPGDPRTYGVSLQYRLREPGHG